MKSFYKVLVSALFLGTFIVQAQATCPIIPLPKEIVKKRGHIVLNQHTGVYAPEQFNALTSYFMQEVLKRTDIPLQPGLEQPESEFDKNSAATSIFLKVDNDLPTPEAYELEITPEKIEIRAANEAGAFNGIASLLQLVAISGTSENQISIPAWSIKDEPKYKWRGLMLDTSRHFIEARKIKEILDWMAFYKLNRFHWHLTDEPGWRLEIKKYPKLSVIGGIGNEHNPNARAKFYTQREIREIITYAQTRNITVIPEIDMPGHATAANRAYPEFSGGGSEEYPEFTFNPGLPATYSYLTDILRETNALFPSAMIHLGGDEVSFGNERWMENKDIQKLMETESLKDAKEVEHYFVKRMADSIYKMNATVLGWDEIADVKGLKKDRSLIFWWRQDKPEQLQKALEKGFKVVLTPRLPLYLDFVQDSSHQLGRRWDGEFNTLEKVYDFSLGKWVDEKKFSGQIEGLQGSLWTETVTTEERLDFLLFPRIAALSEIGWTDKKEDFGAFKDRLKKHFKLYRAANLYFYDQFDPESTPEPVFIRKN